MLQADYTRESRATVRKVAYRAHSRRTAMERPGPVTIIVGSTAALVQVPATLQPERRAVLAHVRATLHAPVERPSVTPEALLAANEAALKAEMARKGSKDWTLIDQIHENIVRLGGRY